MADNAANLLSTPEGYATPDQLRATHEYAKALLTGSGQQPVHHWTQGVSNMVAALVGGNMNYQANQKENEANAARAGRMLPAIPGSNPGSNPVGAPPTGGTPPAGGDASGAISGLESGGNYASLGPVVPTTGDRAYGKYQVMGKNIPEWTQAALGSPMTPDQFLQNPQAQDAVFKHKFGEYTQKYGPEGAARAWFAGEAGMNNPNAHDQLGTTVANYGKNFMTSYAGPGGASQPPAVQAMSAALRGQPPSAGGPQAAGGTQVAAGKGMPSGVANPMPQPSGTGIYINPSLIQQRPQYNEGQMRGILADPTISEQTKMQLLQQYQTQNQPIDIPYPGGTVRVNPNNPSQQQFIPEGHWGKSEIGDIKHDNFLIPNGHGGVEQAPINTPAAPIGPRSDAGPVTGTPAAAPQGGPPLGAAPVQASAQNAPAAPPAPPQAPIQVASLDPTAGVAAAAGNPPAQTPAPTPVAAQGAPAVPATPLTKMVQAAPPPGVSQQDWDAYTQKKSYDNQTALDQDRAKAKIEVDKGAQDKAVEFAAKKYDTLSTQAQSARKMAPNLDLALALTNDARFHSGILAGPQDLVARLKAGLLGDQNANAPNEVFDKLMAGTVLDTMKTALGGLGQVRLAEIGLLTKANANRSNTAASNRAVLEVSRRAVQSIDHLDSMGQQYASGDEVTDPLSGEVLLKANVGKDGEIAPRHGLDVGFDKVARKFTLAHPSFTPEEIKRYETIFDTGKDPSQAEAPGAPAAPTGQGGEIKVGTEKQFKQGIGVWDGRQYVPKDQYKAP